MDFYGLFHKLKSANFVPMWKYLKSREFRLTALALVGGVALIYLIFFFVFLPLYTNHGEEVVVPDVTRMTLTNATEKLEEGDLRYEVVDSLFDSELEPLAVISQDPVPNSRVKPGRRIYLTVNKTVPPTVKFPNIVGVSQYQAKLRLEGSSLTVGKMEYVPHQYANLVISVSYKGQKIKEGDLLPKFAKIDMTIGKGTGSIRVETPNLVGMSYEAAIGMLNRLGLPMAPPRFQPESQEEDGMVIQQSPRYAPGDSISMGTEFVLFIAGPEPPEALEGISTSMDDSTPKDSVDRK